MQDDASTFPRTAAKRGSARPLAPIAQIPVRHGVAAPNLFVILNQHSGAGGGPDEGAVVAGLAAAGVPATVQRTPASGINAALRGAIAARPAGVVVGGGDGTVRSAAAALVGSGIPLGVLPCGTLNHFARDLGMPPTVPEAVKALAATVVRRIDVGEVNGHLFVNNCSLGAYAEAVRRRESLRRREGHGKRRAMLRASYEVFRQLRRLHLVLTIDGCRHAVSSPLVVVANNRYSGRVLNGSLRDRLDAGALWLYTAHVHRRLPALRLALQSVLRHLDEADRLESEPLSELVIESASALPVAMDGEIVELRPPLRFRIRPGELAVMTPTSSGGWT